MNVQDLRIRYYDQADELLGNVDRKTVCPNTVLQRKQIGHESCDAITIYLYETPIVTYSAVALAETETDEIDEDTLRIGFVHSVEQAKAMCQALSGHLPLPGKRCVVAVGVEPYEHGRYRTYLENTSPAGTPASAAAFRVLTETDGKILIGEIAEFTVPGGLAVEARVDTDAQTSSIGADNIEAFKRGGKRWVRFSVRGDRARFERRIERTALVKCPGGGNERRPVVLLEITLCGVRVEREFTLADRGQFEFKALLGRNTLLPDLRPAHHPKG